MAVAARPGPSDARVPCPLCGAPIHPIAGKCKHCKADLTGYQTARPAASTPLPALYRPSNGHAAPAEANGHPAHAAVATAVAAAEAQPVLPPRPTTASHTAEPAASAWRSWPVLVIVLAMLAIVAAVVLMMWPESSARGSDRGKRPLPPPPAPEHMPTTVPDPRTPPNRQSQAPRASSSSPADPWATPSDPPAQDPGGKPDSADDSNDSTDDDDLAPLKDPLDSHASRGGLRFNRPGALFGTMVVHLCRKMLECGVADPLVTNQCERFSRVMPQPPSQCPAATRCFQHIDAMACGTQPATLAHVATLLNQFVDCHDAIRC